MSEKRVTGGCNCGGVRFEGVLSDRGVGACHCKQCRRFASGPYVACRFDGGVRLLEDRGLKWWESSDIGKRGFCGICGATLFWTEHRTAADNDWSVSAGALDDDPKQAFYEHIFWEQRPSYLTYADDAPRLTEADLREKYAQYMPTTLNGASRAKTSRDQEGAA